MLNLSFIKSVAVSVSPTVQKPIVEQSVSAAAHGDPTLQFIFLLFAVIITIVILIVCIVMIFKAPVTIVKTGATIVHQTAEHVAPIVFQAQHILEEQLTPAKVSLMKSRLAIVIKALLVITPLVLAWLSQFGDEPVVSFAIGMIGSLIVVGASALFFVLQYGMAFALSVKRHDII